MKRAIAIRHVMFEDLGVFESPLRDHGFSVEYLEAPVDDLSTIYKFPPDLLVVLGGPIGVYDEHCYPFLTAEIEVIKWWMESRRPILGICLGAQLIAHALGANVAPMGYKEIGFSPLVLTAEGQESCLSKLSGLPVLHWHGDQFEIPDGAALLAQSDRCPHQAFSVGANILALQFHIEVHLDRIEHWLVGHASELAGASIDLQKIREQAHQYKDLIAGIAPAVLAKWISQWIEQVPPQDSGGCPIK